MFFAYNNGITATATEVKVEKGNIKTIKNLQIVNGGQTTSAIYAASKNSKLDVSKVTVQMKLSVVQDPDEVSDFVSKVSQYANTQNKINPSDFFSNSPFHKEFKNYSKRIRVAAVGGAQHQTHWFYERVRGEYLNEQAYLSSAKKRQFVLDNPKNQLLEKTFLSKCEMAWLEKPATVCKGAQASFTAFAKEVTDMLEKDDMAITENYFKNAIAKVILFRFIEKMISRAHWYDGGFRAQTVAYTMAHLSNSINATKKTLNFELIWENQSVPTGLGDFLVVTTELIYEVITNTGQGFANPTQWCKKDGCWVEVKNINVHRQIPKALLVDKESQQYASREASKIRRLDNGIEIQAHIVGKSSTLWLELVDYYDGEDGITPMQSDILTKLSVGIIRVPSEKQSKVVYKLLMDAKSEGFDSSHFGDA